MNHDPEVIKFVIEFVDGAITILSVVFISFLIIMYLIDKRKNIKNLKELMRYVCLMVYQTSILL